MKKLEGLVGQHQVEKYLHCKDPRKRRKGQKNYLKK